MEIAIRFPFKHFRKKVIPCKNQVCRKVFGFPKIAAASESECQSGKGISVARRIGDEDRDVSQVGQEIRHAEKVTRTSKNLKPMEVQGGRCGKASTVRTIIAG